MECPKCRAATPVDGGDVSKLFCNYQLLEAVDAVKAQAAAASDVSCELCDDEHAATHRCVQCAEFMCTMLAKAHCKSKISRTHNVQTIADFKAGGPVAAKVFRHLISASLPSQGSVLCTQMDSSSIFNAGGGGASAKLSDALSCSICM